MSDLGDYWRDVKPIMKREAAKARADNWEATDSEYQQAAVMAESLGFRLKDSGNQINVYGDGWVIQFYPGNQRLYAPKNNKKKAPFLRLPHDHPFTILDVVKALADHIKLERKLDE